MHPSQAGPFRKAVVVLLTLAFTGALLIFTSMANLDLLKQVYPDPKFYMFGLLALEGGVIYWTGYYLLQLSGVHKAIAVFTLAVDAIFSGIGFFYEMETMTKSLGTISLPPIIVVVGFAVVFNVAMSIISHLIPTYAHGAYVVSPKQDVTEYQSGYQERSLAQTANEPRVNPLVTAGASLFAMGQDVKELAAEKRANRKKPVTAQSIDTESGEPEAKNE